MKTIATLATLSAITLSAASLSASAARAADDTRIGDAVRKAMAKQGEIVTPADRNAIAAKCGVAPAAMSNNIHFHNGALSCPDGRTVNDAETRALSDRIGARASAVAKAAVNDPQVVAAINTYANEATRKALRAIREGKR